ncbi:hypothetical protein BC940DRAFT_355620, partial [Gongronella butleri]
MFLHTLPLELVELIDKQLCAADRFQCLFVCHAWTRLFVPLLYRDCVLPSRRAYEIFMAHATRRGLLVRCLDIRHDDFSAEEQQELLHACPLVQQLSCPFFPSVPLSSSLSSTSSHTSSIMWVQQGVDHPTRRSADDIRPACLLPQLTRLTLHSSLGPIRLAPAAFPGVTMISIASPNMDLCVKDIETIHRACPALTTLALDVHALMSNDWDAVDTDSAWSTTSLTIKFKHMAKPGASSAVWIDYLAFKYPALRDLNMTHRLLRRGGHPGFRRQWQQQQAPVMGLDEQNQGHPHHDDNELGDMAFMHSIRRWASRLHLLERVQFTSIAWDFFFLMHLPNNQANHEKTSPLHAIHIVQLVDMFQAASNLLSTLIRYGALTQITTLTLPPTSPDPPLAFYQALGKLPRLDRLAIQQQGILSNKQRPCQLDTHRLLRHCHKLTHLAIGGMELLFSAVLHDDDDEDASWNHQSLQSLALSSAHVDQRVLNAMFEACPRMNRFHFISSQCMTALHNDHVDGDHQVHEKRVPTMIIGQRNTHQWKEILVRHPQIRSPHDNDHPPAIGLSGARRHRKSPRMAILNTKSQLYYHFDPATDQTSPFLAPNRAIQLPNIPSQALVPVADENDTQDTDCLLIQGRSASAITINGCHLALLSIS